jgi:hypothetical protein
MLKKKKNVSTVFFKTPPICHKKKTLKWFLHDSPHANTRDSKGSTFSTAMQRADARKFFFFRFFLFGAQN